MSEWWTYGLADFLLFSPRTYARLFALYNEALWPAQPLVALGWVALFAALWRKARWAPPAVLLALALAWGWVAWAFHLQRYATINWAAPWFAAAFGAQALLLALAARGVRRAEPVPAVAWWLLGAGGLGLPLLGPALGQPWIETEGFGLTPDATVLGSLGVLRMFVPAYRLVWRIWWLVPLSWSIVGSLTLWALGEPLRALLLPLASILVAIAHWQCRYKCAH